MHNITEKLNGNVIKYSVTFLGCDSDGVLVDGTIFLPVKNQTEFEKSTQDILHWRRRSGLGGSQKLVFSACYQGYIQPLS